MTKILLVEDDKNLREIYGVRLIAEGYDIVSAGDGEEALAMSIKERPGLIISDVMMPKISGFDMLDILRSTTETKSIKVIMMTALSSEDQRARGESLGADRYLVKSQVGIEDVIRAVHEVLGDSVAATVNAATPSAPTVPAPAAASPMPSPSMDPAVTTPSAPVMPEPSLAATTPLPSNPVMPVQPEASATAPSETVLKAPEEVVIPPAPAVDTTILEVPQEEPAPVVPAPVAPAAPQQVLGNKVIQPLEQSQPAVNIADLMNQELKMAEPVPQVNTPAAPALDSNPPVVPPAAPLF